MDDWLVDLRYRDWQGRERRKTIGVSAHVDERGALAAVVRAMKLDRHPDQLIDMKARRRRDVWASKTSGHPDIVSRLVEQHATG